MRRAGASIAALVVALVAAPSPAAADRAVRTRLAVKGPVTVDVTSASGRVRADVGKAGEVVVEVGDSSARPALVRTGDRVTLEPGSVAPHAAIRLWVPPGTHLAISTASGSIAAHGNGGKATLRSSSGSIKVSGVAALTARTVSGRIDVSAVSGQASVKTVSGSATIDGRSVARLRFESTSGALDWSGPCGPGCRLDAVTLSGALDLRLDRKSSFRLTYSTFSGRFDDRVGLSGLRAVGETGRGLRHSGQLGRAIGRIDCESFSGTLRISLVE